MQHIKKLLHRIESNPRLQLYISIGVLVLLAIVTHREWFNPFSILEFGDWQYRPDEHVRQLLASWNTWVPFQNMGDANILISGFPFRGIAWSVITNAGLSYDIATKITLFIPVAIGAFLSPFLLANYLFKDRFIACVVALFYGTTAYFLILQTTHLPIAIVYVLLPVLAYWLHRALNENAMRFWVLLSLGYCVGVFYEVRIMLIATLVLIAYFLWFLWAYRVNIKHYFKPFGVAAAIVITGNLFWLIPTKMIGSAGIDQVAGRGLFGDTLFNLGQSFTVMKWSWTGSMVDTTFVAQSVPLYFWLAPLIAFAGLIVARMYTRRILLFLALTLLGLFLTKQSGPPLSDAYGWLYDHIPGFILFREASKFYLLVAFGYFGLIGYTLLGLKSAWLQRRTKQPPARGAAFKYFAAAGCIVCVALLNLKPTFTQELGGTFKNAQMPQDYKLFKTFISKQPDYFRTYWLPRESWWGYYDNQHPKVRSSDMLEKQWRQFLRTPGGGGYDIARNNIEIFKQPFSGQLFSAASIKYIVIPLRDSANSDDFFPSYGNDRQYFIDQLGHVEFLRRVDFGAKELAVFENTNYKPYIYASSSLFAIDNGEVARDQASFVAGTLGESYTQNTSAKDTRPPETPAGRITSLFAPSDKLIRNGQLHDTQTITPGSELRIDQPTRTLTYTIDKKTLHLYQEPTGELRIDDKVVTRGDNERHLLTTVNLNPHMQYYLSQGDALQPLNTAKQGTRSLGNSTGPAKLLRTNQRNLIPNGSFESGLWQQKVGDCNNFDPNPAISMENISEHHGKGRLGLRLSAYKHTACTGQHDLPVTPGGMYYFAFDYKTKGTQKAGFRITFNDKARTRIDGDMKVQDEKWRVLARSVQVPADATSLSFEIFGYPSEDQQNYGFNYYDNLMLTTLEPVADLPDTSPVQQKINLGPGRHNFSYHAPGLNFANQIPNPSFKHELWQKKVADCNNNDSNPQIAMAHDQSGSDTTPSLQLRASRHIACTNSPAISINGSRDYLFGFSMKAKNTDTIMYSLKFDDPAQTVITKLLAATGTAWHTYRTAIQTPAGANHVQIILYAAPTADSGRETTVNYDAFSLIEAPALSSMYHIVSSPPALKEPRAVSYKNLHPTKKRIKISGATGPFYLVMNEGYHASWRLYTDTPQPLHASISPFTSVNAVNNGAHRSVNSTVNGWYIDPAQICQSASACHKNTDGSYDIELVAEFWPQRWFYVGLILSAPAYISASLYLFITWRMHRKPRRG